ncbi:maleylpyruvate isomerase family mycothiol-dependent enzyme [Streptomyces sp. A7024]|uniref:Maleylpyruvate isomerase family mycothiol-dependent enzyme n=1 Tax=Streptomyces coryli TaxID=1128680 RepID=A0A6G4TZ83_9ACTN|nr:maleylpyruvate isomerase family mycothiol-dependent enzyme [Streptomyces coryli]
MTDVSYEAYCTEIRSRSDELRAALKAGDPAATDVPSCPGWTLVELARHVGGTHRWAAEVVRTRATGPVPHDATYDVSAPGDAADPAALGRWVAEGAGLLTDALREAGPDAPLWTVAPGGTAHFWARRMTHETTVHAADAVLSTGTPFTANPPMAQDAVDEWMGFAALPRVLEAAPQDAPPLLGPGRTLHLHATDAADGGPEPAEWHVDLTGELPYWQRAHKKAAVAVRAPLADLQLLLYGRRAIPELETHGDTELLALWLERTSFWLRK